MHRALTLLSFGVLTSVAAAGTLTYTDYQLQCRSNFAVNGGGFNLPDNVFFNSVTPDIADNGLVAVTVSPISNSEGIWVGSGGVGAVEYIGLSGSFMGDSTINTAGFAVVEQTFSSPDGIFFYDDSDGSSGILTDRPIGASNWSTPQVNTSGNVGYRASFLGDYAYYIFDGTTANFVVADADVDFMSPYSFLFTPSFNDNNQIAAKVRLGSAGQTGGSQPDQVRIFNSDGTSILIVEDDDGNPLSPYSSFDNSVSLTNNGWVAFIANLVAGGRGVFISNGATTIEIATTNDPEVNDIEFFGPSANDAGYVVFRAGNASGLQTIFIGNGSFLNPVVTEHDVLPSDLGDARIDQNDSSVVFGGAPRINNADQVIFNCALTPPDNNQIEYGSGIYVASPAPAPPCDADVASSDGQGGQVAGPDGGVDLNDVLFITANWGPCPGGLPGCPGDIASSDGAGGQIFGGDGGVDLDDVLFITANWGPCP